MPDKAPCTVDDCARTFRTPQALGRHLSMTHGIVGARTAAKRAAKTRTAARRISPPSLGEVLRLRELALDPDENVVAVLQDLRGKRWRAVIFEEIQ